VFRSLLDPVSAPAQFEAISLHEPECKLSPTPLPTHLTALTDYSGNFRMLKPPQILGAGRNPRGSRPSPSSADAR